MSGNNIISIPEKNIWKKLPALEFEKIQREMNIRMNNSLELKRIEDLLKCGICYDFLKTSVITPCSHNYCSICVRKFLQFKQQCPVCFEQIYEKDLRVNRALDEIAENFLKLGEKTTNPTLDKKTLDPNEGTSKVLDSPKMVPPTRPARTNQILKTPESISPSTSALQGKKIESPKNLMNKFFSPKTASPKTNLPGTSQENRTIMSFFNNQQKKVLCPVCGVGVCEKFMNKHLDICLDNGSKKPDGPKKRETLPKLVLNMMKEPELRKRLKDHGLSTQGDRKTLEARFQRYTLLYNAECDKPEPRSIQEIRRTCELEEMEEKKSTAKTGTKLQVNRNSNIATIDKAHSQYRKENKSSFDMLIENIKQREKVSEQMDAASTSFSESNITNLPSSANSSPSKDKREDDFIGDAFQDSDSSNPCPLQRYSSINPTQLLNIEFSESEDSCSPKKSKPSPVPSSQNSSIISIHSSSIEKKSSPEKIESLNLDELFNGTTDSDLTDPEGEFGTPRRSTKRACKKLKISDDTASRLETNSEWNFGSPNKIIADSIVEDFAAGETLGGDTFAEETPEPLQIGVLTCMTPAEIMMPSPRAASPVIIRRRKSNRMQQQQPVEAEEKGKIVLQETGNSGSLSEETNQGQSDGTLKRRRGRPKTALSTNNEVENLPKRPTRRRSRIDDSLSKL